MPVIDRPFGNDGPLIQVEVGVSRQDVAWLHRRGRAVPAPRQVTALIDTGAECSCIDTKLVSTLGLIVAQATTTVNAPSLVGLAIQTSYLARLTVLHPSANPSEHFEIADLALVDLDLSGCNFDVLIGRDVLANFDLRYRGPVGQFSLSW